jgi:hypothetical protein
MARLPGQFLSEYSKGLRNVAALGLVCDGIRHIPRSRLQLGNPCPVSQGELDMELQVSSAAFVEGGMIPE